MSLKRILFAAAIAGAVGFSAVGLGAGGVASAVPLPPATPGIPLPQKPHGHGHDGDWNDEDGWGWNGPGWNGPGISACISATGPWGYVTGTACI